MRNAIVLVAAASLVAVLTTGCGGGGAGERPTKEEYVTQVRSILASLEQTEAELENADAPREAGPAADLVDRFGDLYQKLAAGLGTVTPPEEVEESHDLLVEGLDESAGWFHDLANELRSTPASELPSIADRLASIDPANTSWGRKISSSIADFEAKGYSFGADDTGTGGTTGPGDATAGKAVFASAGCGGCHTLKAAGATGAVGPSLDDAAPTYGTVVQRVTSGRGIMPAFGSQLSKTEIEDVAAYVSSVAGG